ncbi:MAG: hypothetical protein J5654_04530 [Victivallales bacterium]|nr:hypothetical protein [Victivallales bacterium]
MANANALRMQKAQMAMRLRGRFGTASQKSRNSHGQAMRVIPQSPHTIAMMQ